MGADRRNAAVRVWSSNPVHSRDDIQSRHNVPKVRGDRSGGNEDVHVCPWCGSTDTVYVQRGFIGPTDDRNQYLACNTCDRITFEIISKTVRDMRVGQFRVGGTYRDAARQTKYTITRILKVGMNESLLYVKPVIRTDPDSHRGRDGL
jgi:hypothetical protein